MQFFILIPLSTTKLPSHTTSRSSKLSLLNQPKPPNMKSSAYLLPLSLVLLLFSCKKDTELLYRGEFQESYQAWLDFKTSSGNSYQYVNFSSSWTGIQSRTTIIVDKGVVVGRSYVLIDNHTSSGPAIVEQWTEDRNTLNSHDRGATTLTLDQIYDKAKTDWLIKRDKTTTYFETANRGMISSCGYVYNNCADDCFNGIHIISIEKI